MDISQTEREFDELGKRAGFTHEEVEQMKYTAKVKQRAYIDALNGGRLDGSAAEYQAFMNTWQEGN